MNEILQERIKELIKARGITQTELADALGISKGTLSDWIKGRYYPRQKHINALATYFNVPVESLITEKSTTSPLDDEIVLLYKGLSDDKKKQAVDYVKFLLRQRESE